MVVLARSVAHRRRACRIHWMLLRRKKNYGVIDLLRMTIQAPLNDHTSLVVVKRPYNSTSYIIIPILFTKTTIIFFLHSYDYNIVPYWLIFLVHVVDDSLLNVRWWSLNTLVYAAFILIVYLHSIPMYRNSLIISVFL